MNVPLQSIQYPVTTMPIRQTPAAPRGRPTNKENLIHVPPHVSCRRSRRYVGTLEPNDRIWLSNIKTIPNPIIAYGGFHKWGFPKIDGLFHLEMDDFGVPLFQETTISQISHDWKKEPNVAMPKPHIPNPRLTHSKEWDFATDHPCTPTVSYFCMERNPIASY